MYDPLKSIFFFFFFEFEFFVGIFLNGFFFEDLFFFLGFKGGEGFCLPRIILKIFYVI